MKQSSRWAVAALIFLSGAAAGYYAARRRTPPPPPPHPPSRQQLIDGFHKLYYESDAYTWANTRWFGRQVLKNPLDLWVMQEIVYDTRPDVLIEAGTYLGGSALYFGNLFDLLGHGQIVTMDIQDYPHRVKHPRVHFLLGSSVDLQIVAKVKSFLHPRDRVMVTLDSDHRDRKSVV